MSVIKQFIERLKTIQSSQIKRYPYEQYECEIAFTQLCHKNGDFANEKLKQMWKDVFHQPFFELHHPTLNSIKTRAVATCKINLRVYIFFIDQEEKYPWIMLSTYDMASCIITKEGFFINERYTSNSEHDIWLRWVIPFEIKRILQENVFNENTFIFKDSPFCLDLGNERPAHYFIDSLYHYYHYLDVEKLRIRKKPLFFIPKIMNDYFIEDLEDGLINIPLRLAFGFHKLNFSFLQKESLEDFNTLVEDQDKSDKFDKIDINQKEISPLHYNSFESYNK